MNCPQCGEFSGETCRCDLQPGALPSMPSGTGVSNDPAALDPSREESGDDANAWRDELSDRLSRYRARRKIRPPRYPSLSLPFESASSSAERSVAMSSRTLEPVAETSLALNDAIPLQEGPETRTSGKAPAIDVSRLRSSAAKIGSAKVIEFPRFAWAPPPPPADQLAEPVSDRPRILEVPEIVPPAPALGGITIEPAEAQEVDKRPGIDFPLQSASLSRRVLASMVDGAIIAAAASLFGLISWRLAGFRPPTDQFLELAVGVPSVFWAVYQYLLIVYSGRTPGMMAAGLTLARFDGTGTKRSLRRWRILGSYLSAASLGMGYAWVFLDEDGLCWHDRITHTYLAPKKKLGRDQVGR